MRTRRAVAVGEEGKGKRKQANLNRTKEERLTRQTAATTLPELTTPGRFCDRATCPGWGVGP